MKVNSMILLLLFSITGLETYSQNEPLSLETARQTALKNHPMIQQGQIYIEQQQTLVKTATLFDPLNINSSFGQINSSASDYYVGISQSFKMPGVYKSEKNLLQQNVNIASATAAVTRNDLIKNVTAAYYNWLYAWQQYRLLNELDSTYRDFAKFADKKFEVGETGILEKTNAKTQLIGVELKKKQAEADIHIYESELHQWMVTGEQLVPPVEYNSLPAPVVSDSGRLQSNPLINYYQQQIAYGQAAVQVEKLRGLPSLSVGGATQSIDKVSSYYIFNAGVNIPIFKNGVKARTKAARLNVQISEKEWEKNKLQLSSAYDRLYEQYNKASDQLKYYKEEGLQYAGVILNAANKAYKAGDIGYVEYVQNINEAIHIRAGYLQTINDYNQTVIQINYLLNR